MRNGDRIFSCATENEKIIGACDAASRRIERHRLMTQTLCHCPISDRQRLFPDMITGDVAPPVLLVHADDVARKVPQMILSGIASRDVHAMHGRDASG